VSHNDTLIELQTDVLFRTVIGGLPGGGVIEPKPQEVDLASLFDLVSLLKGTASSKLVVDRLWFVRDHFGRQWAEAATASETPVSSGKHVAFDAVFQDGSRVEIPPDPIIFTTQVDDVPLPPSHPRFPQTRAIQRNHLPLYGRIVVHDFLHAEQSGMAPTDTKIAVDFNPGDSHVLFPTGLQEPFPPRLFGDPTSLTRASDGQVTAILGQDPRVLWDLDSAEAHWIANCNVGTRLRLLGGLSEDELLDRIATELATQTRQQLLTMFAASGGKVLFPDDPITVDPATTEDGVARELDFGGQLLGDPALDRESFALRLVTRDESPSGADQLPPSILEDQPGESIGLASSGWSLLRDFRKGLVGKFCLDPAVFDPDHPLRLLQPVTIEAGGESVDLESLEVWIQDHPDPDEDLPGGRIRASGHIHKGGTAEIDSDFELTIMLTLDETLRDPVEGEVADVELVDVIAAHATARNAEAQLEDCDTELDPVVEAALRKELRDARSLLRGRPHTVGIRPIALTRTDTDLDWSAWLIAGIALASPVLALGTVLIGETVLEDIADHAIRGALSGIAGGGSTLPLPYLPVRLQVGPNVEVFFREFPPALDVTCVRRDDMTFLRDADRILQLVGGELPDGSTWRLTVADAVLLLTDPKGPLPQMFAVQEDGARQPLEVATSSVGRKYLRTEPDPAVTNNLLSLPGCWWPEPG
jgi:hypothetical protein